MKLNLRQVQASLIVTLLLILIGQGVWVYNMDKSFRLQFEAAMNNAIETAILKEVTDRHEQAGGWIVYTPQTNGQDTARYITKTLHSLDTTFTVTYDRDDPHAERKLIQFLLKDEVPVNLNYLDSMFRGELRLRSFFPSSTIVEYIDLTTKEVLGHSAERPKKRKMVATELIPIDILNTIGIQAYAEIPALAILKRMTIQLILSAILMVICIWLLSGVIRTFFWRERVEQMRQESVNAMTHEFKRPISSAMAQAALIPHQLQKGRTEKVEQYAGNVVLELQKLTAYTDRVQRLSNNSSEHIPLNKEDIALKDFFEAIVVKYRGTEEKKVRLTLSQMTSREVIHVDKVHFANIIENLIENAIKYSKEAVSIRIGILEAENGLKISIKDDGMGIPTKDVPYIFDRFYRSGQKDVQQQVGFGLGLTYVKATVEAHGGAINVASELGVGTEFTLFFPTDNA